MTSDGIGSDASWREEHGGGATLSAFIPERTTFRGGTIAACSIIAPFDASPQGRFAARARPRVPQARGRCLTASRDADNLSARTRQVLALDDGARRRGKTVQIRRGAAAVIGQAPEHN